MTQPARPHQLPTRRADKRLLATAGLVENLAYLMPIVRAHAREQIGYADSFPTTTKGAGVPTVQRRNPPTGVCHQNVPNDDGLELVDCGHQRPCPDHDDPVDLTPTERAVEARLHIERWLADVEASCTVIAMQAAEALRNGNRLIGTRAPQAVPLCKEGLHGRDMSEGLRVDIMNCYDPADKGGHCSAHYYRLYRERKNAGRDVSGMHEPGAA